MFQGEYGGIVMSVSDIYTLYIYIYIIRYRYYIYIVYIVHIYYMYILYHICVHYMYTYYNYTYMYINVHEFNFGVYEYNLDLTSQMAGRSSISIMNLSVSNIFTQRTETSCLYCSTDYTAQGGLILEV